MPASFWYRRWDSNPHEVSPSTDFESVASANSATPASDVLSSAAKFNQSQLPCQAVGNFLGYS